mgnify:CR=1 FL=1
MSDKNRPDIHTVVRTRYAALAREKQSCCDTNDIPGTNPAQMGYSNDTLRGLEDVAQTSLGCGNPLGLEAVHPGDVVLDLGSGTGLDCFLAAKATGDTGQVIGVDMTPEMIETAKRHAKQHGITNVDFRQGQIEALPVADQTVDLVISNCVINLSPDKAQVFREIYRVLRPTGRVVCTDIVATAPINPDLQEDMEALAACVSGAAEIKDVRRMMKEAGFETIEIRTIQPDWADAGECCSDGEQAPVVSARIRGVKPEVEHESGNAR